MNNNSQNKGGNFFERNSKKILFSFTLFSLIFIDVILTRILNHKEIAQDKIGIKHPVYHHTFKKYSTTKKIFRDKEYMLYTNSLGFKDSKCKSIPLDTNIHRIVFMGDSFTEGITLEYPETFVGKIDSTFDNVGIDVLNAGRSGYSPIIYWRKIKYLIEDENLKFDELVVFLDISDAENETNYEITKDSTVFRIREDFEQNKTVINKVNSFISDNSTLLYKILYFLKSKITSEIKERDKKKRVEDTFFSKSNYWFMYTDKNYKSDKWTIDEASYRNFGEKGNFRMIKYMDKLFKVLNKHNVKLTIAVYPWPSQIWYQDLDSKHVKIWRDWSSEKGVRFLNYFPSFINQNNNKDKIIKTLNDFYIKGDIHFNKLGNEKLYLGFIDFYKR